MPPPPATFTSNGHVLLGAMMHLRNFTSGNRSKRILAVAGVAAASIILAGCSSGGSATSSSTAPLKIGISLSLSGDFSDSGKAAERGYDLWAEQANKAGGILGRKVQLTIHDDASSPDQVVSNYTNLITQDKVDIVLGP